MPALLTLPRGSAGFWKQNLFSGLLLSLFLFVWVVPGWANYEKGVTLQAKSILKPELLKGKNFTVNDRVKNDGLFNHYTVQSGFGNFQVNSTTDLRILITEIDAIAAMKKVETDDTALAGLKQSGKIRLPG